MLNRGQETCQSDDRQVLRRLPCFGEHAGILERILDILLIDAEFIDPKPVNTTSKQASVFSLCPRLKFEHWAIRSSGTIDRGGLTWVRGPVITSDLSKKA